MPPLTNMITWRELVELYRIHDQSAMNLAPRYNVAPTQEIPLCRVCLTDRGHFFGVEFAAVSV